MTQSEGRGKWLLVRWVFAGREGLRAGWRILTFITIAALLTLALFKTPLFNMMPQNLPPDAQVIAREFKLLIIVACSTLAMARIERRSIWSYGLVDPLALRRFVWGASWGIILFSSLAASLVVIGLFLPGPRTLFGLDIVVYGAAWAVTFMLVALAEEMLFRGYLQTTLAGAIGFWPAALVLSVAFGLVHLTNHAESLLGALNAALVGGAFCLCLRLSGSLWWGIGFHTTWDWTQSFAFGAQVSGYQIHDRLIQSETVGNPLWSGGSTGPEASVLAVPIICIAAVVILTTFRRV